MQCPTTHNSNNVSCQSCPLASSCSKNSTTFNFSQFKDKKALIIMSGKGGVGKSSVTKMLAHTIQKRLFQSTPAESLCLIDADTKGPSLARLFAIEEIYPKESLPCHIPNTPMYLISNAVIDTPLPLSALLSIDIQPRFLVIDTPPGITDEHLFLRDLTTACKVFVVVVATPDDVCISDVKRQMGFLNRLEVNVLGLIVNMDGFECKACGFHNESPVLMDSVNSVESLQEEFSLRVLGKLKSRQEIARKCDAGEVFEEEFFEEVFQQIKRTMFDD